MSTNEQVRPEIKTLLAAPIEKEVPFADTEFAERLAKVRREMAKSHLDFLLVHHMPNICYLCGYETTLTDWYSCLIVPLEGELTLQASDPALAVLYTKITNLFAVRWDKMNEGSEQLVDLLTDYGVKGKRIGIEPRRPGLFAHTAKVLQEQFPGIELVDASDLILKIRAVKSSAEIECLRRSAKISVIAMEAAVAAIRPGITENQVAAAAMEAAVNAGSEYFSNMWVRAGNRSSILHATYRRHFIAPGDPIVMEFGGVYKRYTAPVYGTAVLGRPSERLQRYADICLRTLDLLYDNVRPGRTMDEVAEAAGKGLDGVDTDVNFTGGYRDRMGYSVGIGFPPDWAEHSVQITRGYMNILQPGMVFHTARSVRLPGIISAAFSETILVTETGCEILTPHRRELVIV